MDPAGAVARLARARERALSGAEAPEVRARVLASWARAAQSGVDPVRDLPPVPIAEDDVAAMRDAHPLAAVWPVLEDALQGAIAADGHILFLSDASGHLLWVRGTRAVLRRAEDAHLVPGALWSEDAAGTSGVGTALALGRPFTVFGPEHYLSVATGYVCSAVPIRDVHGRLLGAVDVTSGLRATRRDALLTVVLAARLAEATLREHAQRRRACLQRRYAERLSRRAGTRSAIVTGAGEVLEGHPAGWLPGRLAVELREGVATLPDGQEVIVERLARGGPYFVIASRDAGGGLTFAGLGRDRAWLRVDSATHELSRRHSELLALLLAAPGGLSGHDLARAVHGEGGKPATVRGELTRLRRVLGHRLRSDPYRLVGEARADFLELERELGHLSAAELLDRYPGPLLPGSSAPGVVELREALDERVRSRVLEAGSPDVRRRWRFRHAALESAPWTGASSSSS